MKKIKICLCTLTAVLLAGTLAFPAAASVPIPDNIVSSFSDVLGDLIPDEPSAPVIESGSYSYTLNIDETVTITEYSGDEAELVIPSELDGHPVSAIGTDAFEYIDLISLVIPDTVRRIGAGAFEYCSIEDTVVFPQNLTFGPDAFSYAELPEAMTIPDGAVFETEAFAYCENLQILSIGAGSVVGSRAFNYSEDLANIICLDGSVVEDRGFEYSRRLNTVYLCGDVKLEEKAFDNCGSVKYQSVGKDESEKIFEMLLEALEQEPEGLKKCTVGNMSCYIPSETSEISQEGYDLFFVDNEWNYMIGIAKQAPSLLDFESDEAIERMVGIAENYVNVDDVFKVRVCGFPSVWININDGEGSTGVYLYIAADDALYYLMFLDIEYNTDIFYDVVNSISIGDITQGTDLDAALLFE